MFLQTFRDERKLGDGEISALGFDEFSRCQDESPGPLKLEPGALKACGHSPLWVYEFLGKLLCLSLGTFTIPHESAWVESGPEPGWAPPALLTLSSQGLQVEPAFMH